MRNPTKLFFLLLLLGLLGFGAPLTASAAEEWNPPWILKAVDIVLVRPTSMVVSVLSTGVYTVLLPITFPTGVAGEAIYPMVFAPWRFTSERYLGDFNKYRDGGTIYR